ncbi:MAG: TRAP transporter small permease [Chloroflexi bacterium]|nr:TRAP transporter small permease [Chloroflexota bacterium]
MLSRLNIVTAGISAALIFGLGIYTFLSVFARYLFHKPFPDTVEWSGYVLVPIVFLGLAYTLEQRRHITIQFLTTRLGKRVRLALYIISIIFITIVALVFLWKGIELAGAKLHVRSMEGSIRLFPFYVGVPVGGLLLLIQCLRLFYASARGPAESGGGTQPEAKAESMGSDKEIGTM